MPRRTDQHCVNMAQLTRLSKGRQARTAVRTLFVMYQGTFDLPLSPSGLLDVGEWKPIFHKRSFVYQRMYLCLGGFKGSPCAGGK
jgi:hypothetical protein